MSDLKNRAINKLHGGMGNPLLSNSKNIFVNRVNFYYRAINQSHGGMGWVTAPPPNSKIRELASILFCSTMTLSDHKCKSLIENQYPDRQTDRQTRQSSSFLMKRTVVKNFLA